MIEIIRNAFPVPEREYIVKRNLPDITFYKIPKPAWGGHLPNPPIDCEKSHKVFIDKHDHKWLDISICHTCSIVKTCENRNRYLKALADDRKQKLIEKYSNSQIRK